MAIDRKLGLKVTEDELSQTIPRHWIGGEISNELAYEIAYAMREFIEKRSAKGYGLGGDKFVPNTYSKAYQESQAFKAYGKKPSPVNMRLSGDMIGSIRIEANDGLPRIVIDDENAPKAHGHQTGQNGKGPLPVRPFFGLTRDEFDGILKKFRSAIKNEQKLKAEVSKKAISETVERLPPPKDALKVLGEIQSIKKLLKLIK